MGGRAGIDADWAALASAWRARYRPTLARVVAGQLPFESLDALHRMMLDELAADGGPGRPLRALSDADRDQLVRAWHRLRPWPDSVPALTKLREQHILVPLSNGGMGLLTRLARAAALPFDCILSAELAGTYKPDPRVYRLVSRYLDVPPDRVLMVACHPDDLKRPPVRACGPGLSRGRGSGAQTGRRLLPRTTWTWWRVICSASRP